MMRRFFERQGWHFALLVLLGIGVALAARLPAMKDGDLWGLETRIWLWIAVGVAVAHQVYVWVCWRAELHASLLTRRLGGVAFTLYAVLFASLIIGRVVAMVPLALANRDTLPVDPLVLRMLAVVLVPPWLYLGYSIQRYFTFRRAFGIDHFDASYRERSLVRGGIFRFTSNGMYVFGFLILWSIALWFASAAALVAALFSHLYIWVHYYCTEQPDMQRIYGGANTAGD
jgi:protein-S-isoprenylcysteine O-methyltransferase Ste14